MKIGDICCCMFILWIICFGSFGFYTATKYNNIPAIYNSSDLCILSIKGYQTVSGYSENTTFNEVRRVEIIDNNTIRFYDKHYNQTIIHDPNLKWEIITDNGRKY